MTHPDDDRQGAHEQGDDEQQGGAVSEVANLGDAEEIQPDQSVAGAPENESGGVQEGRQGPNARTGNEHEDD